MKFIPRLRPLAVIAALLSLPAIANAQMNYQGRLTDSNGAAITGNQATVRFSLYDSETAGNKVWGDFDVNADLLEGRFNVVIGPNDTTNRSINEVFTRQLYLQITLFDDQDPPQPILPALPRQQILNAPYALGANNANHAKTADTATALSNGSGTSPLNVNFTTGNVGIGKAPSRKLDVDGDVFGSFIVRPNGSYGNGSIYSDNNYGMLFRSAQPSPALAAFSFANTNDVKLMTIDPDGDVGIGTTAPSARLHVNGTLASPALKVDVDGITKMVVNPNGNVGIGAPPAARLHVSGAPGELALRVQVNGQTKLAVDPNGGVSAGGFVTPPANGLYVAGKVGIGTANPEVALDVVGRTNITMEDNGYDHNDFSVVDTTFTWRGTQIPAGRGVEVYGMDGSYGLNVGYDVVAPVGIRSDGWIASAMGIVVYSDRRIKRDMQASPAAKDLAAIQQLQVTDYRMVDPADGGMAWRKGFIAQELEKVMPLAVTRSTEFVPDIFAVATAVAYDPAVKNLTLTLAKDHGLKSGDSVRLHIDGKREDLNVSAVPSARKFVVEQCENKPEKVLVYGKQVSDFRTVNYDHIFTTSVGAVQELARKVENQEAELATKTAEIAALKERLEGFDQKFAKLERLLGDKSTAKLISSQK